MDHINRIGKQEYKYLCEVLDGEFRSSNNGKMTKRFEEAFARDIYKRHRKGYYVSHKGHHDGFTFRSGT